MSTITPTELTFLFAKYKLGKFIKIFQLLLLYSLSFMLRLAIFDQFYYFLLNKIRAQKILNVFIWLPIKHLNIYYSYKMEVKAKWLLNLQEVDMWKFKNLL